MAKLNKSVVLYMPPRVLHPDGNPEGARCGRCMMFMPDLGACTVVHKEGSRSTEVSGEHGVCGLYVGGKPMDSNKMHKPMPTVPRRAAGYYEGPGVPTHCGNCAHYEGTDAAATCAKVEGMVEYYGCCNGWEHAGYERRALDVPLEQLYGAA